MKVTNSGHEAKNKRPIHESGKENCCSGDTEPPKKRGRKSAYTDHSCGDCTVWLQTGSNEELLKYHKRENRMRHPGDQCVGFSIFLSCQGVYKISLRSDSCLCNACHRDCLRSCGKPRWLGLSKHIVCKHCFACCKGPETCECDGINEWGPVQCNKNNEIQQWADYFQWDINVNTDQEVNICKSHYVSMHQAACDRTCKLCNCNSAPQWMLGKAILDSSGSSTNNTEINPLDWVCEDCYNAILYPRVSGKRQGKYALARNKVLEHAMEVLRADGACMIKNIMDMYRNLVIEMYEEDISNNEQESFRKIMKTKLSLSGYLSYYPRPKSGSMFYNASVLSGDSLKLVYKLLSSADSKQVSINEEYVRTMVKRQVALSKKSVDFDYRKLFDEGDGANSRLEQYFDAELLKFIDKVTVSDWSVHTKKSSDHHISSRKLKCMMICAIMANNMDPRNCFMQTLIGLACYAQGLRDKGIKLLNAFGVTCSAFQIRKHGSWWAKMRDAIKEINPRAWWRVTFDNLDFRMKFAKKISVGGHLRRMLHLLTSQVTFRQNSNTQFNNDTPLVKESDLKETHFKIDQDKEWLNFAKSTFEVVFEDVKEGNLEPSKPIITKLENHMSHDFRDTG